MRSVDVDAMGVPDRLVERDATNDGGARRIDDRQLVRGLDGDDYATRAGVVLRVSRLSVELDLRYNRVGPCIDHKVPPPRFVRDEDPPLLWRIRDPVREPRPRDARHDPECGIVHDYDGVGHRYGGLGPVRGPPGPSAGPRRRPGTRPESSSGARLS